MSKTEKILEKKNEWYEKLDKLLDCEGILIIKGLKNWVNFVSTFFPIDNKAFYGISRQYKLRNIVVVYSENPEMVNKPVVVLK